MFDKVENYVKDLSVSFGIISAHSSDKSISTNLDRNIQLARAVEKQGFKYFWLDGFWKNPDGTRYEESSLFVIAERGDNEKLYNFLSKQAKLANQDGFIFRNENDDNIILQYTNGESKNVGKYRKGKMGDIYSRLSKGNGRTFVFAYRRLVRALARML